MAIRDILKMGDPRLLRIAQPVTDFDTPALHALIDDLQDTMRHANGAGIAAPQIGEDWQVLLFGSGQINPRYPDRPVIEPTVLINPVIQVLDGREEDDWEGCLSVPGLRGKVPRAVRIRYQGRDARGAWLDRTVEGFHARVVQHECDHLIGRLYPTRMRDLTQLGFVDVMFPELGSLEDD